MNAGYCAQNFFLYFRRESSCWRCIVHLSSVLFGLIDLIKQAAIAKMNGLRFFPASEHILDSK